MTIVAMFIVQVTDRKMFYRIGPNSSFHHLYRHKMKGWEEVKWQHFQWKFLLPPLTSRNVNAKVCFKSKSLVLSLADVGAETEAGAEVALDEVEEEKEMGRE